MDTSSKSRGGGSRRHENEQSFLDRTTKRYTNPVSRLVGASLSPCYAYGVQSARFVMGIMYCFVTDERYTK